MGTDRPPVPRDPDPARVALAVSIWRKFDDRTKQIFELFRQGRAIVGDHCRFNAARQRWELVMHRRVIQGGKK